MSKRKKIKHLLRNVLEDIIDRITKGIILIIFQPLSKLVTSLDFIVLEKVGHWIKQGIVFCTNFLSKKIKIRLWIVLFYFLLFFISLIGPYVFQDYEEIPDTVIENIDVVKEKAIFFAEDHPVKTQGVIFFVIIALMFAIVSWTIGFVWTVILEAALIASTLFFSLYGVNQLLLNYCNTGNESSVCSDVSNFLEESFFSNPRLIYPFIFTVFIPLYSYILRRKRNFTVVRNENFFGLKGDKVIFRFAITNDSKRTRIIKKIFLLINNKVTFLIKDYEEAMLTLFPKEKSSLEMESKYFAKEDKFYFIKGNENLTSAYLFFEMLDGYWGRKIKLTSPINKIMLSSYRVKGKFLTPAHKAKFSQPLVWNEIKKR